MVLDAERGFDRVRASSLWLGMVLTAFRPHVVTKGAGVLAMARHGPRR
jgi:hypothetical protein